METKPRDIVYYERWQQIRVMKHLLEAIIRLPCYHLTNKKIIYRNRCVCTGLADQKISTCKRY